MILGRITWPGIYINVAMAMWGVVSACMGAVHNYKGLLLVSTPVNLDCHVWRHEELITN